MYDIESIVSKFLPKFCICF